MKHMAYRPKPMHSILPPNNLHENEDENEDSLYIKQYLNRLSPTVYHYISPKAAINT